MKSMKKAQRNANHVPTEKRCALVGFSNVAISLIVSFLIFTISVRRASAEQRILTGQEKEVVLTEIADHFKEFPSISLSFVYKQESAEETIEAEYFIVLDDHRNYLKTLTSLHTDAEFKADPDSVKHLAERSWNGSIMRIFNHPSGTGSVRGTVEISAMDSVIFSMFGRDSKSWLERYQNRKWEYEVAIDDEKNCIQVTEYSGKNLPLYARQVYEFGRTKGLAITRYYLENIDRTKNAVERLLDVQFGDFRLVNGFYIPFKTTRQPHKPHIVQTIIVKEAKVNDASHEEFLNGFDFPTGASIYDHIRKPIKRRSSESQERNRCDYLRNGRRPDTLLENKRTNMLHLSDLPAVIGLVGLFVSIVGFAKRKQTGFLLLAVVFTRPIWEVIGWWIYRARFVPAYEGEAIIRHVNLIDIPFYLVLLSATLLFVFCQKVKATS